MKFQYLLLFVASLAICQCRVELRYLDVSNVVKSTKKEGFTCSATDVVEYMESILYKTPFIARGNSVPALDIFTDIHIIYIEENSACNNRTTVTVSIPRVKTMLKPLNVYNETETSTQLVCLSNNVEACPESFDVVQTVIDVDFTKKTLLYRPSSNDTMIEEVIAASDSYPLLVMTASIDLVDNYNKNEVMDKNITFIVGLLLLLIAFVTCYAVATIDYGDDYAGLYSKFKQDKTQ